MQRDDSDSQRIAAFLRAAWKGLVGLEEAIEGLSGQEAEAARVALELRSRELAAAAEQYGFYDFSRLASTMERLAKVIPPADQTGAADILQLLGDTLTVLPMVLDNVAAEGSEDIPQLPGLQWRYDAEAPAAEQLAAERQRAEAPGPVDEELRHLAAVDPELVSFFVVEAKEHLAGMATILETLAAQKDPAGDPPDGAVNGFFRHAHTIKGAAFTVGCQVIGDLAHALEDIWMSLRDGDIALSPEILKAADEATRLLGEMTTRLESRSGAAVQSRYQALLERLSPLRASDREPGTNKPDGPTSETSSPDPSWLPFAPLSSPNPEATAPLGPQTLAEPPAAPGPLPVSAEPPFSTSQSPEDPGPGPGQDTAAAPAPAAPTPTVPTVSVPAKSMAAEDLPITADSSAVRSSLRVDLQRLEKVLDLAGEVTVAHGTSIEQISRLEGIRNQLDDCKQRMGKTVAVFQERHLNPALETPSKDGGHDLEAATKDAPDEPSGPLSVAERFAELEFDRYDDFNILARRIGELSSDLSEIYSELEQILLSARHSSAQVQSLTRRLRVGIGKVRLVPVGRLFARFSRLARKAADEAGKRIEIEIDGEHVEVDNAVMERVAEPLTHLVQNAVHHGLESPDLRRQDGKSQTGTLSFSAVAKGRRVLLKVADDGAGIDLEALKSRAVEMGFRTSDEIEKLDDRSALDLIYLPGLTTSTTVTTSVGRGVGMDAIRHSVHRLGGDIRTETELGQGSTFTLELPVSLLVTEALVVRIGSSSFAVPLPQVEQLEHLFEENLRIEINPADGRNEEIATFDDRKWPVLRPAERLGLTADGPIDDIPGLLAIAVLVKAPAPTALWVDEVIGIEELVVKPVGPFLKGARFFSGATLDTRGNIILMLDLASLASGRDLHLIRPPISTPVLPEPPPRVLLVDDSLSVRRVLGRVLQKQGFEVFTARDGSEALELLLDLSFDAVITDLEMPRLSGYDLIDDLRNRASTRDTPVWVITTRAGARHADLARRLGAVGYLAKPVDADLLVEQLSSVLRAGDGPP